MPGMTLYWWQRIITSCTSRARVKYMTSPHPWHHPTTKQLSFKKKSKEITVWKIIIILYMVTYFWPKLQYLTLTLSLWKQNWQCTFSTIRQFLASKYRIFKNVSYGLGSYFIDENPNLNWEKKLKLDMRDIFI